MCPPVEKVVSPRLAKGAALDQTGGGKWALTKVSKKVRYKGSQPKPRSAKLQSTYERWRRR